VEFTIDIEDLKFYNSNLEFVAEPGAFTIFVGGNSRDVLQTDFKLIE
jgi:beta-glucosidase